MKGLLHSKLFRKNLCKWFFMYIAVIGLFTSVVTYSKYISSMQSNAKTKVAKFDASITYDGVCADTEEGNTCNNGTFRPTSNISYYFTVDTTNFEVSTLFVTRISVLDVFENIKIYDITEGEIEITESFNITNSNILINNSYSKEIYKVYTSTRDINLGENYIRKYKVTMDFDSRAASDTDHFIKHDKNGALIVGYSATQID